MIGQTISHYKILEKLGEGGMGVVYKAEDIKLKRTVALKFLPKGLEAHEPERARFLQEAQAAAALNHPNICTIHDITIEREQQFIVMEYIDGKTLRNLKPVPPENGGMHKTQNLKPETVISYAIQIGEALEEAHSKGVVHRDVKTDNIMVNSKNQVKVMDFGLAKLKGAMKLTKTTSTVGTLAYMAPEHIEGHETDARSDIFSFGVVLYEMLTGHLPFRGEHDAAMMYSIVNEEPQPLQHYLPDAPSELLHVIGRALEKDPEDRYQTVHDMVIDLRRLKKETTRVVRPPASSEGDVDKTTRLSEGLDKWLRPATFATGTFVLLALLYFFVWPPLAEFFFPTERIPIAVITFENQTGDAAFDYLRDAIPNLLTTSLEQSQYMRVTTWERMQDLLRQMGKQEVKVIDRDIGFDLCRRDSVRALMVGSYIKAGEMFATDVKIIDVETKKLLKSASSRGEGVGSILKTQIDDLSKQISAGFGVPEASIAAEQKPVMEVSTLSMDAYNYYLRGTQEQRRLYYQDARRFLEKAVQLDTAFAMAYLNLGEVYASLGESRLSREAYQKAFAHANKTSRRERLRIEAAYAGVVERNSTKRIQILQQLADEYPREKSVHQSLGVTYRGLYEYDKALREFQAVLSLDPQYGVALSELGYTYLGLYEYDKAMETFNRYASVSPGDANPLDDMGDAYFHMGMLDRAIEKYKEAYAIEPKWGSRWSVAHMYALKEDYTTALHYLDEYASHVEEKGKRGEAVMFKGFYHNWMGNLRECLKSLDRATELFQSVGNEGMVKGGDWLKAWIYYDRGMVQLSRKHNNAGWREHWSKRYPALTGMYTVWHESLEGLLDLAEGRTNSARARLGEIQTVVNDAPRSYESDARFLRDVFQSELLLVQDSVDAIVALWKEAKPVPIPPTPWAGPMLGYNLPLQRDLLARACVKKGDVDNAIAEYERLTVIDPKSKDRRFINPRYHYRLARLYEQKGWKDKAIKEYAKFLEVWKNADKEFVEPKDARARLARLKG